MPDTDVPPAQASGTVLYIEDQAANVVLVEGLLAELPGVALIAAGTGAEGIRLARSERWQFCWPPQPPAQWRKMRAIWRPIVPIAMAPMAKRPKACQRLPA